MFTIYWTDESPISYVDSENFTVCPAGIIISVEHTEAFVFYPWHKVRVITCRDRAFMSDFQ